MDEHVMLRAGDRLWLLYEVQAQQTYETVATATNPDGTEVPLRRLEEGGSSRIMMAPRATEMPQNAPDDVK